ncbi:penicillin-binding protein 2, partial [Lacticaseibacillus paracasei]
GTAQGFARESKDSALTETITESFVGYAPAKDPKIAIAVIIPNLKAETTTPYQLQIAKEMFTDFYQMNNIKEDKDYSIHQKTVNG